MGFADLFKAGENNALRQRVYELEAMLTPEMRDLDAVREKLKNAEEQIDFKNMELLGVEADLMRVKQELCGANRQLIETSEAVMLQSFGLYEPSFDFATSDRYKEKLSAVRKAQKEMIKAGTAATGNQAWTVNGSAPKGRKMVSDMQKLLLRAFNSECDEAVSKVRFNNMEAAVKRMSASVAAISKLGSIMSVAVTDRYYNLKIDELHLAYEYQLKKQEEKEEQQQARAELREQAKLQRELEDARREIAKEQKHYENALSRLVEKMADAKSSEEKDLLLQKKSEIESQLSELDKSMRDVDYRVANQKAGYVYVISNIGAFGENIYKIGMTRRLEPMDRIDELGDASVPFKFDVHAMIFTDDAPGLEAALHRAFDDRKLNMVNTRREFFDVSLDEIEDVIRESYDKTVDIIRFPPAEQYRKSKIMRAEKLLE